MIDTKYLSDLGYVSQSLSQSTVTPIKPQHFRWVWMRMEERDVKGETELSSSTVHYIVC